MSFTRQNKPPHAFLSPGARFHLNSLTATQRAGPHHSQHESGDYTSREFRHQPKLNLKDDTTQFDELISKAVA